MAVSQGQKEELLSNLTVWLPTLPAAIEKGYMVASMGQPFPGDSRNTFCLQRTRDEDTALSVVLGVSGN